MFKRSLAAELKKLATQYRIVTLLGPRQSGKTTLVRSLFPRKQYFTLENPDTRELALTDPRRFLSSMTADGCILDEIQKAPELLSYIQGVVDESPRKGQFVLTGSHQARLQNAVSQSLAGRTSISTLYPLTMTELHENEDDSFSLLFKGFYPGLHNDNLEVNRFYQYYINTYVERDLTDLIHVREMRHFRQFLKLLAGRVGSSVNYSSLASDVGVSDKTIKEWIAVLEASFLIITIPPYYRNFGKRLTKAPKIFFTDTGLLCHLLGIRTPNQAERDPLRGNIYENLIVAEIYKRIAHSGEDIPLYFYRDKNGTEVDLLLEYDRAVHLIEVKSAHTYTKSMLSGLLNVSKLFTDLPTRRYLIFNGEQTGSPNDCKLLNIHNLKIIPKLKI